ncbi:MAG: LapA family protein [Flavobacteriales bacterium]|nr:LapA family protein [Flavobacteriales bacterium]
MKDYWEKLSFTQKLNHIFWGVVGLLILIFALLNWKVFELNLIFGTVPVPVTILILVSMFGGYGYAKIFGFIKSRKKDKEISYLEGEVAALREKVRRPDPVSKPTESPGKTEPTKEIEE